MRSKRVTEKSRAKCGPYLTMLWRSKSVKIALLGILTLFVIICYLTSTSEEHRSRQFQSATDCDASYLKTVESRRDSDESVTLDTFDEDDFAVFNIGKDAVDLGDCVLATHLQVSCLKTLSHLAQSSRSNSLTSGSARFHLRRTSSFPVGSGADTDGNPGFPSSWARCSPRAVVTPSSSTWAPISGRTRCTLQS